MSSRIQPLDTDIVEAVRLLRSGSVVALPSETVYGLAGDAFQPEALVKIFEAKGRPLSDPLIVHVPEFDWLERIVRFESIKQRNLVGSLAQAFWPGPLTLLLPKREELPDLVTAGSQLVAVRVTSHPVFREVLRRLNSPLAAPSANRFGSISPTTAADVQLELGEFIPLILDGGPCRHGVESTIVLLEGERLEVLRPGPISIDQLKEFGHVSFAGGNVNRPGSLPGHYAPKKELQIINSDITPDTKAALLAFQHTREGFQVVEVLSPTGDLREAAVNFYGALRRLDRSAAARIFAEPVPEIGIGVAIMDRLGRASYGSKYGSGHHKS